MPPEENIHRRRRAPREAVAAERAAEVVRFQKTGSPEFKRHSTTRRQQITGIVIPADSRQPADHDESPCTGARSRGAFSRAIVRTPLTQEAAALSRRVA